MQMVEAGAHDGQLMLDILTWFNEYAPRDSRPAGLRDPRTLGQASILAARQAWQSLASGVRWFRIGAELPPGTLRGIIFSNELLDAFPAHRFGWDARARRWFEYGVTLQEDRLAWCRLPTGRKIGSPPAVPEDLQRLLPDGFTVERVPEVRSWWHRAAEALGHGLSPDHRLWAGLRPDSWIPSPGRNAARLSRPSDVPDLLADPGEQDLTRM
jgi:SAM-dependent MidA family methyltransferase